MALIYHITPRSNWLAAQETGEYSAASLETEGFIHCSQLQQIAGAANRYYQGQADLVILCIDPDKLTAQLVYENTTGGSEPFPHVYGPIPNAAIERVIDFPPNSEGSFTLPASLTE